MIENNYIINADDFGINSNVNKAVNESFKKHYISSATIMSNMPGFNEACQMIADNNLKEHIGIHFVLTEGVPLTDWMKRQSRFCDRDGKYHLKRKSRVIYLSNEEKESIYRELNEQIKSCIRNGFSPTHIDSHHHVHEEVGILLIIIFLMKEYCIPYIRIMNNMCETTRISRRIYIYIYNRYLKICNIARTKYFGTYEQYIEYVKNHKNIVMSNNNYEIMIHPVLINNSLIIDRLSGLDITHIHNRILSENINHY